MTNSYQPFARYVSLFPQVRVLCLGDIMLDRYVYGSVSSVSQEAPVPILAHRSERVMLGAVGNVARNVATLGGQATIVSIVGDDDAGREIAELVDGETNLEANLVTVSGRQTTLKTRYVAQAQQLMRADREDTYPLSEGDERRLLDAFESALADANVVVISDYAKGCLSDATLRHCIRAARKAATVILADPKKKHFSAYDGVDLIKPNAQELEAFTGIHCGDDDQAAASARKLLESTKIGAVLVTRSDRGMTLVERGREPRHFQEKKSEVFDVSGAGDTALAVLGLAAGVGADLPDAAQLANKTCAIAVSKVGTAAVHTDELVQALQTDELESAGAKVNALVTVLDRVARWRTQGETIGFTNGCFDLIHPGHVSLLTQAKTKCDRLIVGLNTDDSVRRLKGNDRPINNETARALVLASLGAVDAVVLFGSDTPMRLIKAIRPDVLIKGNDYRESEVVGAEFVKSQGGQVFLAELAPESSTTETINRIKG